MSEHKKFARCPHWWGWRWPGPGWRTSSAPSSSRASPSPPSRRTPTRHLKTNGGIETAIGLGLVAPKTRKLAVLGLLGYVGYLAVNVVRNR